MNKYVTNLTLPNGTNVLIKDSECRTNLSNEIRRATAKETELEEGDTHLRNDLTTETNARKQSDTVLQQNINAEVSAREQGDNKNNAEIAKINSNITGIENKNTEQDNEISTLRTMISAPYNFKGDVASISALPASGNVNDTYYVQDVKYKVTWTGSAWVQSSLSEADYQTELSELNSNMSELNSNIGDVKLYDKLLGYGTDSGLVEGLVGGTVTIGTQSWWQHGHFSVTSGKKYKVQYYCDGDQSYMIYMNGETIVANMLTGGQTGTRIEEFVVPNGVDSIYVNTSVKSSYTYLVACWEVVETSAMNGVSDNSEKIDNTKGYKQYFRCDGEASESFGDVTTRDGRITGFNTNKTWWRNKTLAIDANSNYAINGTTEGLIYFTDDDNWIIDTRHITGVNRFVPKFLVDNIKPTATKMVVVDSSANHFWQDMPQIFKVVYGNELPNYYKTYMDEKIATINEKNAIYKGISFAFITDLHFGFNREASKYLLKYILDRTNVPFVVCGGDIPSAKGVEEKLKDCVRQYMDYISLVGRYKWYGCKGNHDFTIETTSSSVPSITMTKGYQYDNLIRNQLLNDGKYNGNFYYYLDVDNVRVIVVDMYEQTNSGDIAYGVEPLITTDQLSWLGNLLTTTKDCIVVTHATVDNTMTGFNSVLEPVARMLQAVNNRSVYEHLGVEFDFSTNTNRVFNIAGHSHKDESHTQNGLLSITTASDGLVNDAGYTSVAGTTNEQLFDIVSVDTENRSIKLTRIGAGADRALTY